MTTPEHPSGARTAHLFDVCAVSVGVNLFSSTIQGSWTWTASWMLAVLALLVLSASVGGGRLDAGPHGLAGTPLLVGAAVAAWVGLLATTIALAVQGASGPLIIDGIAMWVICSALVWRVRSDESSPLRAAGASTLLFLTGPILVQGVTWWRDGHAWPAATALCLGLGLAGCLAGASVRVTWLMRLGMWGTAAALCCIGAWLISFAEVAGSVMAFVLAACLVLLSVDCERLLDIGRSEMPRHWRVVTILFFVALAVGTVDALAGGRLVLAAGTGMAAAASLGLRAARASRRRAVLTTTLTIDALGMTALGITEASGRTPALAPAHLGVAVALAAGAIAWHRQDGALAIRGLPFVTLGCWAGAWVAIDGRQLPLGIALALTGFLAVVIAFHASRPVARHSLRWLMRRVR